MFAVVVPDQILTANHPLFQLGDEGVIALPPFRDRAFRLVHILVLGTLMSLVNDHQPSSIRTFHGSEKLLLPRKTEGVLLLMMETLVHHLRT